MPNFEFPEDDAPETASAEPAGTEPTGSAGPASAEPAGTAAPGDTPAADAESVPAESQAGPPSRVEPEQYVFEDVEPERAEPQAQRRTARGALLVGARIVTGTIGVAVAIAAVAAAGLLPLPTIDSKVPVTSVTPVPADQHRVCAGPLLSLGSETGEGATTARSTGHPTLQFGATSGTADRVPLESTDSSTGVTPWELTLPADNAHPASPPLLAGGQTQTVEGGDLAGLAAAECREASSDSWLVGGSTVTGRTTLLTMSNPGSVIATVNLTIYTELGEITAAGTDGIVVPPGGQRILSLAAFAPGAVSPVVRVQSSGSQVVANLQQSVVRTLETGGVDVVGTSTPPSRSSVIPGLLLVSSEAVTERSSVTGYEDLGPIIRLFVPGNDPTKAEITLTPESATTKPTKVTLTLAGGTVTEVPLGAFPDGSYTVGVTSELPVVAGARSSSIGAGGNVDLAWFAATPTMSKRALVAVADGPSPRLHLANPTGTDAAVTVKARGASDIAVTVPAGGAVTVPVTGSKKYTLTGFVTLAISVGYSGDGALASYGITPAGPTSRAITVYPR